MKAAAAVTIRRPVLAATILAVIPLAAVVAATILAVIPLAAVTIRRPAPAQVAAE